MFMVQVGVAMASAAELSFNWMGFISAMVSNLTFGFRAVLSKKCVLERSFQLQESRAVQACVNISFFNM